MTVSEDIADKFASKYKELYTSVTYGVDEMQGIRCSLSQSCISDTMSSPSVCVGDVLSAIRHLKPDKSDGNFQLHSNHFLNAREELSQHIALLSSAMLVHGCAVGDLVSCTLIPIPKDKNTNAILSDNHQGIALSSLFGKIFDLIF